MGSPMKDIGETRMKSENGVGVPIDAESIIRGLARIRQARDSGERRPPADRRILERSAILLLGIGLYVLFSVLSPHTFFTAETFQVIVSGQTTILLLAIAASITLRAGDFDLSISAEMVLSGCVAGILYGQDSWPAWLAISAALLVGPLAGAVNGFFVVVVGVDSLIVTLGMVTLLTGIANGITGSNVVAGIPPSLATFSRADVLGVPAAVWVGWAVALVVWYIYEYTPIGKYLIFIGGSRPAATLAGIKVSRIRFGSYLASGLLSSLAGVLLAGTLGAMDPGSGNAYLLAPYAAVFLGATVIQPGRFNIMGTLVGLYVLAIGIQGLNLIGVQGWISDVFYGGALLLAVAFARYTSIIGARRKARIAEQQEAAR
jgi:ribose transport system permease protein